MAADAPRGAPVSDDRILRIQLSDGRHVDVPLGWLREQLAPQELHIVGAYEALALGALADAPLRQLRREQDRSGWRGRVAGFEVCRRLQVYADSDAAERAAIDAHNRLACEPGPRPTKPKPRS